MPLNNPILYELYSDKYMIKIKNIVDFLKELVKNIIRNVKMLNFHLLRNVLVI